MKETIIGLGAKIIAENKTKNIFGDFNEHYIFFEFLGMEYVYSEADTRNGKSYCLTYFDKKGEHFLYTGTKANECEEIIKGLRLRGN